MKEDAERKDSRCNIVQYILLTLIATAVVVEAVILMNYILAISTEVSELKTKVGQLQVSVINTTIIEERITRNRRALAEPDMAHSIQNNSSVKSWHGTGEVRVSIDCACCKDNRIVGPSGPPGSPGKDGTPGLRGLPGPKGDAGPPGEKGRYGAVGLTGQPGPQGNTGVPGRNGSDGTVGLRGPPGSSGETGATGATGATVQGSSGIPGPRGSTGATGVSGEIKGEKGERGLRGYIGERGMKGAAGSDGIGLPGPPGPVGDTGASGARGDKGEPGEDGQDGTDGEPGSIGVDGSPGQTVVTGVTGAQVIQEVLGQHEVNGTQGEPGSSGAMIPSPSTTPKGEMGEEGIEPGQDGQTTLSAETFSDTGTNGSTSAKGEPGPTGAPRQMSTVIPPREEPIVNDCIVTTENEEIKVEGLAEYNVGTDISLSQCEDGCQRMSRCVSLNYNAVTRECILYRERLTGNQDCHRITGASASNWIYKVNRCAGQTEGCTSDDECMLVDRNALCNMQTNICFCGRIEVGFDGRCGTGEKVDCPGSGPSPSAVTTSSEDAVYNTAQSRPTTLPYAESTTVLDITYTPVEITTTSATPPNQICAYKTLRGAATGASRVVELPVMEMVTVTSMAACQRQCNDLPSCNAVNYETRTGRCELLNKFVTDIEDCHVLTGDNYVCGWMYRYKDCAQVTSNPPCSRQLMNKQVSYMNHSS